MSFVKGEGPLGNLLEMGKEVACAEGLLRREVKGGSETLHPTQRGSIITSLQKYCS